MTTLHSLTVRFFDKVILKRPILAILFIVAVVSFLGYKAKDFTLDASAETLVLQNDEDLRYSRLIDSRYGLQEYLVMTYAPEGDLLSDNVLSNLTRLRDELKGMERVSSVVSILDVPLLESPPVPVKELAAKIQTLESETVDKKLAKIEFKNSPLYQNLLVSPDLKTTALLIYLPIDDIYRDLLARRNDFQEKQADSSLTASEVAEFRKVIEQFRNHRDKIRKIRHQDIAEIRAIMDKYRQDAQLFLGGVSMIADDLISFIKNDLKVFGLGVLFFLILTLGIIFRKIRWILLPILCCAFSAISMMGLLGLFDWEVTVISSNFISLQLIITMAITIHLIVRYRELSLKNPEAGHRQLILDAVRLMMKPCLYAALTTIAGFGSLLLCDILPVITFGWMMSAGISVSLVMTFLLFPPVLMLTSKEPLRPGKKSRFSLTSSLAGFTQAHGAFILIISGIAFILSVIGISRLEVENSFIDYFKHTTEIYQGMKVIDQNLGGTTPLDVIVDFEKVEASAPAAKLETTTEDSDEFDEFDEFDEAESKNKYWFTSAKMARVVTVHDYLCLWEP